MRGKILPLFCLVALPVLVFVATGAARGGDAPTTIVLTSSVFSANAQIPAKYTCQGDNLSPPVAWSAVPAGAKSLALLVDDPDAPDPKAPKMTWVHWVLYNIPVSATGLPEAVKKVDLPAGTLEGLSSWKKTGYGGPCPPVGRHRYFFKLYVLDMVLNGLNAPDEATLVKAMAGHILAQGELIGTYQKKG